ncbi:MAG: UDP-glucuronosyltransferase, partial [Cytophagaceae bacterium]
LGCEFVEQFLNASYIEKEGFGRHFHDFTPDQIRSFLYELPFFESNLEKYQQNGNSVLFDRLGALIKNI